MAIVMPEPTCWRTQPGQRLLRQPGQRPGLRCLVRWFLLSLVDEQEFTELFDDPAVGLVCCSLN